MLRIDRAQGVDHESRPAVAGDRRDRHARRATCGERLGHRHRSLDEVHVGSKERHREGLAGLLERERGLETANTAAGDDHAKCLVRAHAEPPIA